MTVTATLVPARDLVFGQLIDLEPLIDDYTDKSDPRFVEYMMMSEDQFAMVEKADTRVETTPSGEHVVVTVIYNDLLNFAVPSDALVEVHGSTACLTTDAGRP